MNDEIGGAQVVAETFAQNTARWAQGDNHADDDDDRATELDEMRAELEQLRYELAAAESARRRAESESRAMADDRARRQSSLIGLGIAAISGAIISKK